MRGTIVIQYFDLSLFVFTYSHKKRERKEIKTLEITYCLLFRVREKSGVLAKIGCLKIW